MLIPRFERFSKFQMLDNLVIPCIYISKYTEDAAKNEPEREMAFSGINYPMRGKHSVAMGCVLITCSHMERTQKGAIH